MPRSGRGDSNLLPKFQALQKQVPRGSPLRNEAGRALASQSTKLSGDIKEEDEDEQDRRRGDKRNVLLPSNNGRANGGEARHAPRPEGDRKDASKTASNRATPYDQVASNLSAAIKFRETGERVRTPGKQSRFLSVVDCSSSSSSLFSGTAPVRPRDFIACWLDYAHKYGMGYALTDGSVGVQFNDDTTMVLAPNKTCVQPAWVMLVVDRCTDLVILSPNSHIDHIRPRSKDDFDTPRDSLRADVEPSDKKLRDRKFLLNHFEAYMEGKLHAGEKYCEKDTTLNTGMSYLAQYWRMKQLIVFRISSGVLQVSSLECRSYTCPSLNERVTSCQLNYHDHSKLILSDEGLTITYIDNAYSIWTWHLASLIQYETSSEEGSRERRRMESAWRKLTYAR